MPCSPPLNHQRLPFLVQQGDIGLYNTNSLAAQRAAKDDILFSWKKGDDTTKVAEIVNELKTEAGKRNPESIDMLTNLALRPDDLGKLAEEALFDLFSRPPHGLGTVDLDISNAALKLYNMKRANSSKSIFDLKGTSKFESPSPLLYMAGAEASAAIRKDLSEKVFSSTKDMRETDLWGTNRLVTDNELGSAVFKANEKVKPECFNSPISLIQNNVNMVSEMISEKIKQGTKDIWPQYFPVHLSQAGGHWALLGINKPKDDTKEPTAFVFSSLTLTNKDDEAALNNAVSLAGCKGFTKIEADLQSHVPNGCGLFVAKAIEELANSPNIDPEDVISNFRFKALKMSAANSKEFNILGRRELYGDMLKQQQQQPAVNV